MTSRHSRKRLSGLGMNDIDPRSPSAPAAPVSLIFSSRAVWVTAGLLFTLSLVPILLTPIVPLIDYYNHFARFFVLSHLDRLPYLGRFYAAHWQILPNLGLDLIGVPLAGLLPPLFTAKLLIVITLAVQFSGVIFLSWAVKRRVDLLSIVLSALLLYSFELSWGFVNFLIGISLGLWGIGTWLLLRDRPWRQLAASIPFGLAIFISHGFAFMIYGAILFGLELGLWLDTPQRRMRAFVVVVGRMCVQVVLPVIVLMLVPVTRSDDQVGSVVNHLHNQIANGTLWRRVLAEIIYRLTIPFRTIESPFIVLDVLTLVGLVALFAFLFWRGVIKLPRFALPAFAILALLYLVMPPSLLSASMLPERLPLAVALLFAACCAAGPSARPGWVRGVVIVIGVLFAVRTAAIASDWMQYRQLYQNFRKASAVLPRDALVVGMLDTGGDALDGLSPRCQMLGPLLVPLGHGISPLFAFPGQQPLRMIGPLKRALAELPEGHLSRGEPVGGYFDDQLAAIASSDFDDVIVCGANRLTRPIPGNLRPIFKSRAFDLYRIGPLKAKP